MRFNALRLAAHLDAAESTNVTAQNKTSVPLFYLQTLRRHTKLRDRTNGSSYLNATGGNEVCVIERLSGTGCDGALSSVIATIWNIIIRDKLCTLPCLFTVLILISATRQYHNKHMYCTHTAYEHADIAMIAPNPYLLHFFLREYHT